GDREILPGAGDRRPERSGVSGSAARVRARPRRRPGVDGGTGHGRVVSATEERRVIGRVMRAQARGFAGDLVLLGVAVAAFLMSLSLAVSVPPELSAAPGDAGQAFAAPLSAVIAIHAAILAAVYGSFRYTIDRRDGVVAQ